MNIRLFNKNYWIRRFGVQKEVKGYLTSGYEDFVSSINLHPLGTDAIQALPEGERKIKRLEGHGEDALVSADEKTNQKGDMVYYHGNWYECVSSQMWDHTILSHYNYQFVLVPTDASNTTDLEPPDGDPIPPSKIPPETEGGSEG